MIGMLAISCTPTKYDTNSEKKLQSLISQNMKKNRDYKAAVWGGNDDFKMLSFKMLVHNRRCS